MRTRTILSTVFPLLVGCYGLAQAATTIRLAHFWPASAYVHEQLFTQWKDSVEAASNGELVVQIYPGQTLSKADAVYDNTVKGVVTVGAAAQGYNNGRFPLSQIAELPGLADTAVQGSCVLQRLYDQDLIADEYDDSHVLFMFTLGPGLLHSKEKAIRSPDDLKGLRIRRPTAVAGELLESMGALPVGMPAPEVYMALKNGVIDGLSFPWEGMKSFRINELVNHHTQMPFYSMAFVVTMNKKAYEALSPELKQVIDDHSGMVWAVKAGEAQDGADRLGLEQAKAQGDEIVMVVDPLADPVWQEVMQEGIARYLRELVTRDLDGEAVYVAAKAASQECKTRYPVP